MTERQISEVEVEAVLAGYTIHYHDRHGNHLYVATVGTRRIKVVVAKDSAPPRIITAAAD